MQINWPHIQGDNNEAQNEIWTMCQPFVAGWNVLHKPVYAYIYDAFVICFESRSNTTPFCKMIAILLNESLSLDYGRALIDVINSAKSFSFEIRWMIFFYHDSIGGSLHLLRAIACVKYSDV